MAENSEKESYRRSKKKAELAQERAREELRQLLSTVAGRKLAWWILEASGVYRTTFSKDALLMAFQEGMRQMGLKFIERLNDVDERLLNQIVVEHKQGKYDD